MPRVVLPYPPQDRDQLWWAVKALFGVSIPRTRVCPDHCAPFDAFADAYFRECTLPGFEGPVSRAIWHASRGLAGKSYTVATLGLTFAYIIGADITILGGSLSQSNNVHEYMVKAMEFDGIPDTMTVDQTVTRTKLSNSGRIRPLPASQRNVRGPHPSILLMDEADEMDLDIYDAALGQPMQQANYLNQVVDTFTVVSSTWQNADGCVLVGTPVWTIDGEVPIEKIRTGDKVLTRDGWREVTNSIDTGQQETVTVNFRSGRSLTCTPWHPVWTSGGWVRADSLTVGAHVVAAVGGVGGIEGAVPIEEAFAAASTVGAAAPPSARQREVVPMVTDPFRGLRFERSPVVFGGGHGFEVPQADARPVHAPGGADVVDRQVVGDRPVGLDPYPAVRQVDPLSGRQGSVAFEAVAVPPDTERPDDALVGVQIDDVTFTQDEVVNVHHSGIVLPTWDLTVGETHEYVAGGILVHNTFTEILRRAEERHQPVYRWCYKESSNSVDGWLTQKTIAEKIESVSAEMFRIEYDLGEPSIGNRAFDAAAIDKAFSLKFKPDDVIGSGAGYVEHKEMKDFEEYRFARAVRGADYVAGADWAKEQDKTVIWVARIHPPNERGIRMRELVYYLRLNRRPYPQMIGYLNKAIQRYRIPLKGVWHDSTGLGNVVNDYLDIRAKPFPMTGDKRAILLSDYVNAVEKGTWILPRIPSTYFEHKYCSTGDLYSHATTKFHLPDSVCAAALAEYAAKRWVGQSGAAPQVVVRTEAPSKLEQQFRGQEAPEKSELMPEDNREFSLVVD